MKQVYRTTVLFGVISKTVKNHERSQFYGIFHRVLSILRFFLVKALRHIEHRGAVHLVFGRLISSNLISIDCPQTRLSKSSPSRKKV